MTRVKGQLRDCATARLQCPGKFKWLVGPVPVAVVELVSRSTYPLRFDPLSVVAELLDDASGQIACDFVKVGPERAGCDLVGWWCVDGSAAESAHGSAVSISDCCGVSEVDAVCGVDSGGDGDVVGCWQVGDEVSE